MMEKRILAAPAAWAAAVIGPAMPEMDMTIVIIDVSMLSGVSLALSETILLHCTYIIIVVTLDIWDSRYNFTAYQKERAKVLRL